MRLMPTSFIFFLLTAVAMLLQVIPFTGIFLMFLMAPLWSVVLINFGMLGIVIEAVIGRVYRWWLILPAAWFGAYAVAAVRDNAALNALRVEVTANNMRVQVPFDPRRQSLVLVDTHSTVTMGVPEWVIGNYSLPVVYNYNSALSADAAEYFSTRLVKQGDCKKLRELISSTGPRIIAYEFHNGQPDSYGAPINKDFCLVTQPEMPQLPQVRVLVKESTKKVGRLQTVQTITIIETPTKAYRLRGGSAAPLRWFPMLAMGCTLDSGTPSWDCNWGFLRAWRTPLADTVERDWGDSVALGNALGLRRVSSDELQGTPPELLKALMQRAVGQDGIPQNLLAIRDAERH